MKARRNRFVYKCLLAGATFGGLGCALLDVPNLWSPKGEFRPIFLIVMAPLALVGLASAAGFVLIVRSEQRASRGG